MTPEELYNNLRAIQEPKGYFFNRDMDMTMDLLRSLIINKERFGYMACPCRLACGVYEQDKDIILSLIHISEPTRQAESRMPSSA